MAQDLAENILHILMQHGPVSTREIGAMLEKEYRLAVEIQELNSLLYGQLRERVIRDKDEDGYPTWRIKVGKFEASKGLEVLFFNELLRDRVVTEDTAQLGYGIHNRRNGKTYDLDIAVVQNNVKLNIEIDGFEHIRADARLSIQEQIETRGENTEIEIDWMDNRTSFTDFKLIDNKAIYRWFLNHKAWTKRYHEELLKPHDITRNIWLIENGWRVIRFWNFEINEDLKCCLQEVKDLLEPSF